MQDDDFFNGGGSRSDQPDNGEDTGDPLDDTGDPQGGDDLAIDDINTNWEEYPNSNTGCLLNICYKFSDPRGTLDGGQVYIEFEGLGDEWVDIGGSDARILDEKERGCKAGELYVGFDIDNDDYELKTRLKGTDGKKSEDYETSIASDDAC